MGRAERQDLEIGIGALLGGIGMITLELSALVPGLLAGLILTAALAAPLVIVAAAGAVLIAPPVIVWRIASRIRS